MFGIEMASRGVGSIAMSPLGWSGAGVSPRALYVLHARAHPQPMLDFRMMQIATFRLSVICGSLSRIAVGAMPFLLPMMLQLGFGLSRGAERPDHVRESDRIAGDAARARHGSCGGSDSAMCSSGSV